MKKFGFYPSIVNENVTRWTAGLVVLLSLLILYSENIYLAVFLWFGFLARVSYGPKFEPLVLFVSRVLVPKLGISFVPTAGPPKRFAQLIGLGFTSAYVYLLFVGEVFASQLVLGTLVLFASLEAVIGFCAGCFFFAQLMKVGVIPEEICERCNNLNFQPRS